MRQGVRKLLRRIGLSIIAEGDNYEEASTGLDQSVEIVLIMVIVSRAEQFEDGLAAISLAGMRFPKAKRIVLAEGIDEAGVLAATLGGADALLSPHLPSAMLGSSVQLVLLNQTLFPTARIARNGDLGGVVAAASASTLQKAPPAPLADYERAVEPVPASKPREPQIPIGVRLEEPLPRPPGTLLNLVWNSAEPVATNSARPLTPSDREWEILKCLANGGSNKSIARQLGIAETTVKVHVKSLLRKLGVANRTQAAIWALNHGQTTAEPAIEEASRAVQNE